MAYYKDLREYLEKLEASGGLRRIKAAVDKDRELHPLVKWQYRGLPEAERFGFLFENVTDGNGRTYEGKVASSVIAPNRDIYAQALGCTREQVSERWIHAYNNPVPPRLVETGPVKEEIHKGDSLLSHEGLFEFPIPISTNGWEAFPRITATATFSRDPDTGVTNVGMYNSIVLGPLRANIRTARHLHLQWEKRRKRGQDLEAAIVIGAPPVVPLLAATDVPYGLSELDVAGGLIGEPLELVHCETVDIDVPAWAEVVIEGIVPKDRMDIDGPSGENRGHVMPGARVHPFEITAITHRKQPVWHDLIEGFPPTESSVLRSVNCEGRVMTVLQAHGIPFVKDVAFHDCGSARHLCVLRFQELGGVRVKDAEVWTALYTVMSVDPAWPKVVIAVDEDIDPRDLESVMWAVINRHQPHRDVKILQGRGAGLDESVAPRDVRGQNRVYPPSNTGPQGASIMLLNATRKWASPPISLPRKDYMERAHDLWEELGLPPLKPRIPWHGVSLGYWLPDEAELVELSETGRRDEAAQKLLARGIQLD